MNNIYSLLRKRYPSNEYALMAEVRDKAGFGASRSADYIAVNLWPSRGLAINGIELKSFRGDWLRELKNPKKAENIFEFCDFFWLLTADETVATMEEIPETWGWITIKGSKIITKKKAPKLAPRNLDKHFVCSMLKRAVDKTNFIHTDQIEGRIKESYEKGSKQSEYRLNQAIQDKERLTQVLMNFKEGSGIDLLRTRWGCQAEARKIGETVRLISNGEVEAVKKELTNLESIAKNTLSRISSSLDALNKETDQQFNIHDNKE